VWFPQQADDSAPPPAGEHEDDFELRRPLRLTGAERSYELTALPAVIGRRSTCPVVLDTPDVSLTHALLFSIEDRPAIFDLGSRSGTYLNGQRVGLAWLADGDELSIGGEKLSLTFGGLQETPPTTAAAADPTASVAEADNSVVDVLQNTARLRDSGRERLDARPSSARAPTRGEFAALSQREAALDEREARLAAAERELACRQAELAERERANAEAAAQVAASLDELRETCRVLGLTRALAAQPTNPNSRPVAPAGPSDGLGGTVSGDANARIGWQHVADAADRPGFAPDSTLD
jgi:pSer/pThr/pTyr-binding forkhead associated (FHA) protein